MLAFPQSSLPSIETLLERLRTTDYRRLALSIWGAFVTACVYTYIAGQITRRAVNFHLPHVITALKTCASILETLVDSQPSPTLPATPLPSPPQCTSSS